MPTKIVFLGASRTIPSGYRRVTLGNKRGSDRFLSRYTYKFVRYDKSDCADRIGKPISELNLVIRKIEKRAKPVRRVVAKTRRAKR